ncbi:hypothetical protein IQ236_14750 [Planktothrix mougeotii LEGE 06226]|uniref:EamA domain-containing protein n=1 Tax=Planktothrix mougeotii LEGE 06226 TaxID=1828728 RepID=A0ABR9UDC5_9CYAN|nr:hypothetical protein [Planktothrix mougeotii LEGE 06226]
MSFSKLILKIQFSFLLITDKSVNILLYFWLQVEGVKPDQWDLLGATICLVGTMIILFAPHRNPV